MPQHGIDQEPLEHHAQNKHRKSEPNEKREGERHPDIERSKREKCRHHHEFALCEIDGLRCLPQQGETDRDERVDRSGCETG